jgi:hypothetical protein
MRGIIAALDAGLLDPFDPWLPEERRIRPMGNKLHRQLMRRARRRARFLAKRLPF